MTLQRRERTLLWVLLLALGVVAWRYLWLPSRSSDLQRVLRGEERASSSVSNIEVEELQLAELAAQPNEFHPGRDPWRFDRLKPVRTETRPPPPPPPRTPPPAPTEEAPPAEPPKARPPEVDVVYLGSFGPSMRRIAVFTDDEAIYNAASGDTLKGKFRVETIGFESVDLTFVGFPDVPAKRLPVGG